MRIVEQHDEIVIFYSVSDYPGLFRPRQHPQQPGWPTKEIENWLLDHGHQFWMIQQFYHMRIVFKDRATAALFKLTFS